MNVQLFCLVNIFADSIEQDGSKKELCDEWL